MELQTIAESDLASAEPGLYVIGGKTKTEDRVYDVEADKFVDGPHEMTLMARVREHQPGRGLPLGVERAFTRPDGREVILQWQMAGTTA